MAEINNDIEDDFEDDDDYEFPSFTGQLYDHLSPAIKQFLINYFAERLVNAEAQILRDIEQVIKDDIRLNASQIPDYLYRHRTISHDEFDDALDNFKRDANLKFNWPQEDYWYDRPDEDTDEDDGIDYPEQAKKIIDAANKLLEDHNNFKRFMQPCCSLIIKETQLYLEKNAVFDLTILTPEGFIVLQNAISFLAETLAEDLQAIISDM